LLRRMGRPRTIHLRENHALATKSAKVIDADFQVIKRRTIWDRIVVALAAIFWAAVIGFALPQARIISQRLTGYFGGG
jgi:hypothetical protein